MRIGTSRTPDDGARDELGPTTSATRYDDSGGVGAKVTRRAAAAVLSSRMATPFESATASVGHARQRESQVALNAGSSKQGKTRRASAASNWVTASGPAR